MISTLKFWLVDEKKPKGMFKSISQRIVLPFLFKIFLYLNCIQVKITPVLFLSSDGCVILIGHLISTQQPFF